jgi:hypothetical protein
MLKELAMKYALSSLFVTLVSAVLLNACGSSEDSNLSGSEKKPYHLRCLTNISFNNGQGNATYTMRAEGSKVFKQKNNHLVEPKKEHEEYKKVLIDLQMKCNGSYDKINASGCGLIKYDQPELFKQDPKDPSRTNSLAFEYNAVGKLYKGEYFCFMVEAPVAP